MAAIVKQQISGAKGCRCGLETCTGRSATAHVRNIGDDDPAIAGDTSLAVTL